MVKANLSSEHIAQWSEDAEIRFFDNDSIAVDNYDTEVSFSKDTKFQAVCHLDTEGNIQIVPYGTEPGRGPRSITLIDNGIGKIKKSPMGKSIKLEIILPLNEATYNAFERNLRVLMKQWTQYRKTGSLTPQI